VRASAAVAAASVLLVLLLAGCALPGDEDEADEPDPLFGLCPQWTQGQDEQSGQVQLGNGTGTQDVELGPAAAERGGRPLDLYRVTLTDLTVDGRLELRAHDADGDRLLVRDFRQEQPQLVPVVVFTDGSAEGQDFEVYLSPITSDDEAEPTPASLTWSLNGTAAAVSFDVTFHYKVCGAGDL